MASRVCCEQVSLPYASRVPLADVFKSTADIGAATELFERYTQAPAERLLRYRDLVIAQKRPRKVFVQPHLALGDDGNVVLEEFEASEAGPCVAAGVPAPWLGMRLSDPHPHRRATGMIASMVRRFGGTPVL